MEFRDLKTQYKRIKGNVDDAVKEIMASSAFIGGSMVEELEMLLAEYVGVRHCVSCANGTDALQLALMSWGIGAGDAVFVPDFTFFSTAEVVVSVGACPVFTDISKNTFNVDSGSLEAVIKHTLDNTELLPKAVIAVDLFGRPADYTEIRKLTDKYNLLLLEDGAQGFGGKCYEKRACSFGDISATSFFPSKPLGCYGDGGAVFTDNDEWDDLIRSLRIHGKGIDKYDNVRIGMNSRLDAIQAAVLIQKLKVFDDELKEINKKASLYNEILNEAVVTPIIDFPYYSSWAQYSILLNNISQRDRIIKALKDENIPSMVYYRKPLHKQNAFSSFMHLNPVNCNNTEYVCDRVLSLPISPYIADDEIIKVSNIIKRSL